MCIRDRYNVERTAIHRWSIKYDNKGLEGLKEIKKDVYKRQPPEDAIIIFSLYLKITGLLFSSKELSIII